MCTDANEVQPVTTPTSLPASLLHVLSSRANDSSRRLDKGPASGASPLRKASAEERTVSIFLDRTDLPLSPPHISIPEAPVRGSISTYAAVLAFARDAAFPASVYPPFGPKADRTGLHKDHRDDLTPPDLSRLAKEDPRVLFTYLGNFATLRAECAWLGLRTAEREALAQIELLERIAGSVISQRSGRRAPSSTKPVRDGWI